MTQAAPVGYSAIHLMPYKFSAASQHHGLTAIDIEQLTLLYLGAMQVYVHLRVYPSCITSVEQQGRGTHNHLCHLLASTHITYHHSHP
jgi:hypothetical protein